MYEDGAFYNFLYYFLLLICYLLYFTKEWRNKYSCKYIVKTYITFLMHMFQMYALVLFAVSQYTCNLKQLGIIK
jgi:hypothetical protein